MRISRRERGREVVGKEVEPTPVMGKREPLSTTMEEEEERLGGEGVIPEPELMCDVAPLSKTHSPPRAVGGCRAIWFNAAMRAAWSH